MFAQVPIDLSLIVALESIPKDVRLVFTTLSVYM